MLLGSSLSLDLGGLGLGLESRLTTKVSTPSGGQRQKTG